MIRRHLKGAEGDAINSTLAARGLSPSKPLRAIGVRIFVLVPERLYSIIRELKTAIQFPRMRWSALVAA